MSVDIKNRRTKMLIEPTVQTAVAMRLILLWVLTLTFTAGVSVIMAYFSNPTGSFFTHIGDPRHWMPSIIAFVAILPVAVLNLIRFSHRFAGPVHRLRNEMQRLAAGKEVQPIQLREHDYWQPLAADFNQLAARVHPTMGESNSFSADPVIEPAIEPTIEPVTVEVAS